MEAGNGLMGRLKERGGMSLAVSQFGGFCLVSYNVLRSRAWCERDMLMSLHLEKVGLARLFEALEAHEWENSEDGVPIPDYLELEEADGLSQSAASILGDGYGAREPILLGPSSKLKEASNRHGTDADIADEGTDDEIQQLEGMMLKLQAIKDIGADMPEAERRKMAAKAVGDLMKKM